jgi:hypothetical protein
VRRSNYAASVKAPPCAVVHALSEFILGVSD